MRQLILLSFLFLNISAINGQKFLQIERTGSLKVKKFYIGEELTFQLVSDKNYWRTEVLQDLIVEENILIFPKGMVKMEDIYKIKTFYGKSRAKTLAFSFYTFGAGWVFYSLVDALLGGTLSWSVAIVSGTAFASGWLIQQIFSSRTYKMGNRRRLRMLDVTFKKDYSP